jgi:hypothetical protein
VKDKEGRRLRRTKCPELYLKIIYQMSTKTKLLFAIETWANEHHYWQKTLDIQSKVRLGQGSCLVVFKLFNAMSG